MPIQRCCPPACVVDEDFSDPALLLKALADPHRLAIMATLAASEDEVCVCDFTDGLPLNQPTVSHHLRILREAELVTCERRGTWVYYRLARGAAGRARDALACAFQRRKAAA
jgi:ArsR family transcriptional regulator